MTTAISRPCSLAGCSSSPDPVGTCQNPSVSKAAALVMLALVGCGRIGFDLVVGDATRGGTGDGLGGDGPPATATSCVGLANTCGPTGTGSCCDSPVVPGGSFARSYDVSSDGMYPDSRFAATVSAFRLDKYEVTVGRFRQFVAAGMGTQASPPISGAGAHPNIAGSGWDATWNGRLVTDTAALVAGVKCDATFQPWTDAPGGNESRPINCVTWYEAMAFCAWDGGFMPTEAEWNYAATGGSEQRAYPWSSPPGSLTIDGSYASYWDGTNCVGDGLPGCAPTDLLVVGTKPAGDGRWGQSDLGGNIYEWALDWYASPYAQNPCTDCANLTPATLRAFRGGNFSNASPTLRAANRVGFMPSTRILLMGIRCARSAT